MSRILILVTLMLLYISINAQNIGINETGNPPHPSAMLDIVSPDKGILIPRLPDHTAIAAPAQGLLVYNSTGNGFWYWDGTQWLPLLGANSGWQILGNAGIDPLINFLGTTDAAALMFRVNDTQAGRIDWNALTSGTAIGQKGVTSLGYSSLSSNTSGYQNTALGFSSGSSVVAGHSNVLLGAYTAENLASGNWNTMIGARAARQYASGDGNTMLGTESAPVMTSGNYNIISGFRSAFNTDIGNENILIGYASGYSFNNGTGNILLGSFAGRNLVDSDDNILIGRDAGMGTAATYDGQLLAIGWSAARSISTGTPNTIIGYDSGRNLTTGSRNTFLGFETGRFNSTGDRNVYIGDGAGRNMVAANGNISIGVEAGYQAQTSSQNVFIGEEAGRAIGTAIMSNNVYIGYNAGRDKYRSNDNVAIGWGAMAWVPNPVNTVVQQNVAVGRRAGSYVQSSGNVFVGYNSGLYASSASQNTFVGARTGPGTSLAGQDRPGGSNTFIGFQTGLKCIQGCERNTILGTKAGEEISTGANNVFIGYYAGFQLAQTTPSISNRLVVANNENNSDILIYGEFDNNRVGINTIAPDQTLSVNGNASKTGGGEWVTFSDRRVKSDISLFEDGLDIVMNLNPVKYRYNALSGYNETEKEFIGFIAQDVEEIAPYMVSIFDDSDGPSSLADKRVLDTSALNQILVNAIQEQQVHIESLEERVNHLESLLLKVLEEKEAVAEKK
jgi:hypothetical protein